MPTAGPLTARHRQRQLADRVHDRVVALGQHLVDVWAALGVISTPKSFRSAPEEKARPGSRDHTARAARPRRLRQRREQVEAELLVPRVQRLRAVELDRGDPLASIGRLTVSKAVLALGARLSRIAHCGSSVRRWCLRSLPSCRLASYGVRMARPVIGICTALERARWSVWDQEAALLPRNYIEAVHAAGGLAVMIPPDPVLVERPERGAGPARRDGAGGRRRHRPRRLRRAAPRGDDDTVPERDAFEIALVRAAIARELPCWGSAGECS